jgi:hypothetical protein
MRRSYLLRQSRCRRPYASVRDVRAHPPLARRAAIAEAGHPGELPDV